MDKKLTVAAIFGGQSSEHEISCMSAVNVISAMDKEKYNVLIIGITQEGRWTLVPDVAAIKNDTWKNGTTQALISPDATQRAMVLIDGDQVRKVPVDVIFPILHGMYGEDGTVQGLFELAKIPYVGCGVLASAVSMDKVYTKIIVDTLGIRQADYVVINHLDMKDMDACVKKVEAKLSYPVFVKPSKAGSSKGVNKAVDAVSLKAALEEAIKHDIRILVEETIIGREIECAVLGGYEPKASGVGEILAADTFYSFEAKYYNEESRTDLRPVFPEGVLEEVRDDAVRIFQTVDGYGLARVDFFLEKDTNAVIFNEINTLPGFTGISMYPMLWEDQGVEKSQLIDRLIAQAFERYKA